MQMYGLDYVVDTNAFVKAAAYIIDANGKYLFQKRSSSLSDGSSNKISLFGGGIDIGETVYEGLVRELYEELELQIRYCMVNCVGYHVSSQGVVFVIFEVQVVEEHKLCLHEGSEIIVVEKKSLYDEIFVSWFQKINSLYLYYLDQKLGK